MSTEAHTRPRPAGLAPGIYIDPTCGHVTIAGDTRTAAVLDLSGVVQIAGIDVTDWVGLDQLGRHLVSLASRHLEAQTTPAAPTEGSPE